jgi:TPR repeat protein
VKWYRKAAEQGQPRAQFNLGISFANGLGVAQDYDEAFKWYRKAAEQGYPEAQFNLGISYARGQGVPPDYAEAVKWCVKAAEQGFPSAQYTIGSWYEKGKLGFSQDCVKAAKWYRNAAEQGDLDTQYALGALYYTGDNSIKDYTAAFKWLSLAAAQGSKDSARMLEELKVFMTPAQITEGQRLVKEFKPKKAQSGTTVIAPFRDIVPAKVKPGSTSNQIHASQLFAC